MTILRRLPLAIALLAAMPAWAQAPSVAAQHAWARATPGGARSAAVYLTLLDQGAPDRLLNVSTPVAGLAELHESFDDHGIARMRLVGALPLEPGKPVALKPGGLHIMLTELDGPLMRGAKFPLTLTFEKAPPVIVTVTVVAPGAMGPGEAMPGMKMP